MKGMNLDENAQMHVLETVIAALLFFGAVQVGVQLIPDTSTTSSFNSLRITGEDSLRALHRIDPMVVNSTDYYNSSLVYFIIMGKTSNITAYLNATLDTSVSYEIGYTVYPNGTYVLLYAMQKSVRESVVSHFSFFYQGKIYDIRLALWIEQREVI